MEKIAILVDVQNVYYTCREQYGRHFDYNQFWSQVTQNRTVVKANAYAMPVKIRSRGNFIIFYEGLALR